MKNKSRELTEFIQWSLDHSSTAPVIRQGVVEIINRFNEPKLILPKKFKKVKSNVWQQPVMEDYLMKCCDCGLVHSVDFRIAYGFDIKDNRVQLKMERMTKPNPKLK